MMYPSYLSITTALVLLFLTHGVAYADPNVDTNPETIDETYEKTHGWLKVWDSKIRHEHKKLTEHVYNRVEYNERKTKLLVVLRDEYNSDSQIQVLLTLKKLEREEIINPVDFQNFKNFIQTGEAASTPSKVESTAVPSTPKKTRIKATRGFRGGICISNSLTPTCAPMGFKIGLVFDYIGLSLNGFSDSLHIGAEARIYLDVLQPSEIGELGPPHVRPFVNSGIAISANASQLILIDVGVGVDLIYKDWVVVPRFGTNLFYSIPEQIVSFDLALSRAF